MTVEIQLETFTNFYQDSAEVMAEHDKEVSTWGVPYQLDLPLYRVLEAQGKLWVLTAREAGEIVGYLMWKQARHPHYPIQIAWEDAHFLAKHARKGLKNPWFRMVRMAKEVAKANGAKAFVLHEKRRRPLGRLLEYLGFEACDTLWMERL